jgi:hypothetical protein
MTKKRYRISDKINKLMFLHRYLNGPIHLSKDRTVTISVPLPLLEMNKRILVRFEVFTALTMKNVAFWDIRTLFVLHRRHITSPLHSAASECYVRFEVFTALTMKNVAFWDIKTQFVLHRRHLTSPLQSPYG